MSTAASHRLSLEKERRKKTLYGSMENSTYGTDFQHDLKLKQTPDDQLGHYASWDRTIPSIQRRSQVYLQLSPIFAAAITLLANRNLSSIRRAIHDAA
ncbi:hypothetical protein TWF706_010232 [Orbilia oligospora]|nr:hypothetical protein TWF706_010232 [Orbilia oligospora]